MQPKEPSASSHLTLHVVIETHWSGGAGDGVTVLQHFNAVANAVTASTSISFGCIDYAALIYINTA